MNTQKSSEKRFKSPNPKPNDTKTVSCFGKQFTKSNAIIALLSVAILIVLFYISFGLYGHQAKSQEANYRSSPQTYLSNGSIPQFYIVLPDNMPDSDLNPAPAVAVKPVYRNENDLSIYLLTYNVARQSPAEDLTDLFDFQRVGAHDIYVVAIEELTFWSMVTWDPYTSQFDNIFGERGYVRLERVRFMITSLSIYVPKNKLSKFHNVTTDTVTTDLGLRKGGIGIRLYYNNISLAFVGAHLAAHEEHYQTRLKNYREIMEGVHFSHRPKDGILDQDYAFFIGDLNFRINDLTSQQVYDAILFADKKKNDENKWIPLLQYDQLHVAQKLKEAFHHFKEANITFPPTYRFIISTDNYDWEKRKPAFTDRILYRNTLSDRVAKVDQERVALRVLHYESIRQYCGSDHKPVRAIAHISASAFDEKNKWLQSRVKHRLSKRDSPVLRAKRQRSPVVRSVAQGAGSSADSVVADSHSPRHLPRSRHYYHEDPSLSLARQMTVQFEPIRDWTVESNHTINFRVVDSRTNQTVGADFPGLFQVLSNWDWIGLYKEDFYSLDNYVTFAYPRFGETVEEAEDALSLLHDETEDQLDHLQPRTGSQASTRRGSASSVSSLSQSTSSAAYLSSNELSEGHPAFRSASPETIGSVAPLATASQVDFGAADIERVKSLDLGESPRSVPKPSVEEAEDNEERKETSPVSSVSGSGDDSDHSSSESASSPASISQTASSSTTTTTTTSSSTTSSTTNSSSDHEFTAMFDEQSFLFSSGRYVLIYRRKNGDVMGISEPFEIRDELGEQQQVQPPNENAQN